MVKSTNGNQMLKAKDETGMSYILKFTGSN
jgi:hypothetical protein